MPHTDKLKSMTRSMFREDSQKSILLRETFFARLGGWGVLRKNVSQSLAIIDFLKQRN